MMVHIGIDGWSHEAYIKRDGVYHEYDYESVKNDELFIETSFFYRNGIGIHFYELASDI